MSSCSLLRRGTREIKMNAYRKGEMAKQERTEICVTEMEMQKKWGRIKVEKGREEINDRQKGKGEVVEQKRE